MSARTIVISAVNLRDGGPLSVLKDCLRVLENNYSNEYKIVALVHKRALFSEYNNIEFIEYPKSASYYFYRIFLEYFYFKKLSKKLKAYLWFSLHDISPNVCAGKRAVYCHNPAPFYKISLREAFLQPSLVVFNVVYRMFYSKNIKLNDFVVVQQDWLRNEFIKEFGVDNVVVSYPSLDSLPSSLACSGGDFNPQGRFIFVYPTFPRVFKNLEILCEAVEILIKNNVSDFEVWLTLDGTENKYSRYIRNKYDGLSNIKFMGLQRRETVVEWYKKADALIFPSKLETWGLPITEFKMTGKPILVVDLPYAHETVGDYDKVSFFSKADSSMLAECMEKLILDHYIPEGNRVVTPNQPFVVGWGDLFEHILR